MQGLLVVLAPAVLMLFALAMQRLEARLGKSISREGVVADLLLDPSPANLAELAEECLPGAAGGRQEKTEAVSAAAQN